MILRILRRVAPFLTLLTCATLAMYAGFQFGRPAPPAHSPLVLEVVVINVGEGEASFARTPKGHFILIGGGPPEAGAKIIGALKAAGVKHIDLLVLPYPYAEAIGALPLVLNTFSVGVAVESGYPPPGRRPLNQYQQQVHALLSQQHIPTFAAHAGDKRTIEGAEITFLAPPYLKSGRGDTQQRIQHASDGSLVLRLVWRDTAFLWAGGIEREGERELLGRTPVLQANWLRVARFATRESSSPEFLKQVSPEIVVISVGTNSGGYPHRETLERLKATGAKIYRTDQSNDTLLFRSDGTQVTEP